MDVDFYKNMGSMMMSSNVCFYMMVSGNMCFCMMMSDNMCFCMIMGGMMKDGEHLLARRATSKGLAGVQWHALTTP